jgi:hypothetical protein
MRLFVREIYILMKDRFGIRHATNERVDQLTDGFDPPHPGPEIRKKFPDLGNQICPPASLAQAAGNKALADSPTDRTEGSK